MRLFVSVPVPPAARADLAAALAGLRTTDVAQWHVTLAFLGDQDDAAPLVPELARAAAASPPLRLRVEGGGSFPGVLWAGLAGDVAGLRRLAAGTAEACRTAGVRLERRPFRPHVTVARRVRDGGRLDDYVGPEWVATEVHLVHSVLGPTARHAVLERFPLRG